MSRILRYKLVLIGLAMTAGIGTAAWAGLKSIPVSYGYELEAEFAEMPENDTPLEMWLRSHPGVAAVVVGRREGAPNTLVVIFVQVRDGWGHPPLPDLESICDELGYTGRVGRFQSCAPGKGGVFERSRKTDNEHKQ